MDRKTAAALLRKYRLGECTEEEKSLVEQWYNLEAGKAEPYAFNDISRLKTESWHRIRNAHPVSSSQKGRVIPTRIFTIAASVAALLCIGFFWFQNDTSFKSEFSDNQTVQVKTSNGELRKIFLPDSSVAILNGGTSLSYSKNYGESNREVVIDEGEVFFDVKHNTEKAFLVTAGRTKTQVLGTAFSVRAYKLLSNVRITVTRGKVGVRNSEKYPKSGLVFLLPDDQLTVNVLNGNYARNNVDAKSLVMWTEGFLHFDNEKLNDIAILLEKKFNVSIHIGDTDLSSQRITAKFRPEETLDEVLENLALAVGFDYKQTDNQVAISAK